MFSSLINVIRSRDIYKIHTSHTLNRVFLSVISIYIPIYLLTLGYALFNVIIFFIIFHLSGLIFAIIFFPYLIRRLGLVNIFKIYYPITIIYFILLNFLSQNNFLFLLIAVLGGISTFSYWIPINILIIKNSNLNNVGSNLANFFAIPKIFAIFGPLISAIAIPVVGFWPMFVFVIFGLVISYIPLLKINNSEIDPKFSFDIFDIWKKIKNRKLLFFMEGLDNVIEESEWFWGIIVFLTIGSLSTPGIVGSLEALGGAVFTILIGKLINKKINLLIPLASGCLVIVWLVRFFIQDDLSAYLITLVGSFAMTFFLVSYFSMIYKKIKGDNEEEFIIIREIPTVIGRMIVFGVIILITYNYKSFFILPIFTTIFLLLIFIIKKKHLVS